MNSENYEKKMSNKVYNGCYPEVFVQSSVGWERRKERVTHTELIPMSVKVMTLSFVDRYLELSRGKE